MRSTPNPKQAVWASSPSAVLMPNGREKWSMWQFDLGPDLRSAVAVEAVDCQIRLGRWSAADTSIS